jgi:simple sugar transport system permease protein
MRSSWLGTLANSTVMVSAPLILAAIGGWCSERGGVINIALEGKMLTSACVMAIVGIATGNAYLGLAAGVAGAVLMAWLHWLLTHPYKMDHVVSGMAINALALGATNYLDKRFTDPARSTHLPLLPLSAFYFAALILPLVLAFFAKRTRGGLHLMAVGSDPRKAEIMGVAPARVRFWGLTAAGVLCGLSGALIVTNTGGFTDGMTAGRGFIALAALILGGWRPIPAACAALAFGFFEALRVQVEGTAVLGIQPPTEFWACLPYLITVIALAGLLGRSRAPAGLGKR